MGVSKGQLWRFVAAGILLLTCHGSGLAECTTAASPELDYVAMFVSAAHGSRPIVAVEALSQPGCEERMLAALNATGADVRFADRRVGYAMAMVPREKVMDILDLPGLQTAVAADRDSFYANPYQNPAPGREEPGRAAPVPKISLPYPRVATELPPGGPYFAADEAGLTELWRKYPLADGRGVRIAVADRGLELLHPALQFAKDLRGNSIPKTADVISVTTPADDEGWVQLGDPISIVNGHFEALGSTWIAPSEEGVFRFGLYRRTVRLGVWEWAPDPTLTTLNLSVGLLWNEKTGEVRVDTDGDHDFRNERVLHDFGKTQEIAWFGQKDSDGDNRIPFGVKADRAANRIYLSIADSPHGGMIEGTLAANRVSGGLFDGAAPSAQLIDVRSPPRIWFMQLMLRAFARKDIDVLNVSGILGYGRGVTNESFWRSVIERAIAVYDKPLACYCDSIGSLHVSDYQSREMLRRNRQLGPPYWDAVNGGVDLFPDGRINLILAPSANLTTESRYMPFDRLFKDGRRHFDGIIDAMSPPSPDGYTIGANPSPTIPVVTGILADLVGEARREHVRFSAPRLTEAVAIGARVLGDFPAAQQGFGVVDANAAWEQLKAMSAVDDPNNPVLTSFTVEEAVQGDRKPVQGYQADEVPDGQTISGELWVTRHGGYAGPRSYRLDLKLDDKTYSLPDRKAVFIRDQPTVVHFKAVATPGLHVAFLQLIDAQAGVVMQEIPLAVRTPHMPATVAAGVEQYRELLPPRRSDRVYVELDKSVQAAGFRMTIPYAGGAGISARVIPGLIFGVAGDRFVPTTAPSGPPVDAAHHVGPIQDLQSLYENSTPGIQEAFWENRGRPEYETPYDPPAPDIPISGTLTVTQYAIKFAEESNKTVRATNQLAELEGHTEFYDANIHILALAGVGSRGSSEIVRTIPGGLTQWRISLAPTPALPVDVFLLDCTNAKAGCQVAQSKRMDGKGLVLAVDAPKPGEWRVLVRSQEDVPAGTRYEVREAMLTAAVSPSSTEKRASGETWLVPIPTKKADAQYVAFLLTVPEKSGAHGSDVRIELTPLDGNAP